MRKAKTYYASRGHLSASGASKADAKSALESMVNWACSASSPIVESRFGLLIIVAACPNGYNVAAFDPAELSHGQRRDSFCLYGQSSYATALQSGRMHAAQLAWRPDVDDSAFVVAAGLGDKAPELESWIRFQRSYIAAKLAGHTDSAAFNLAIGLPAAVA